MTFPRFFQAVLALCFFANAALAQTPAAKSRTNAAPPSSGKNDVLVEKSAEAADLESIPATRVDTAKDLTVITFGSCNKVDKPPFMFDAIAANNPDLWIWLGDIIYCDTTDMAVKGAMYKRLKNSPEYRKLTSKTPVIGMYDDHDYGVNDAGKGFPNKKTSKKLLMDFLGVPANAPVRKREGAYQSYTFGKAGHSIKVILLDTRYFRDTLIRDTSTDAVRGKHPYTENLDGDMLGEAQWEWLEHELRHSTANLNLLCTSIQVISNEHPHEKWGNFPNCRKRLLNLIVQTQPKNLLILSGDRHMAEISKMDLQGLHYPLYDFTSSGMTHTRTGTSEANKFRVGEMLVRKNFGLLKIQWNGTHPIVTMQVRTLRNEMLQEITVKY